MATAAATARRAGRASGGAERTRPAPSRGTTKSGRKAADASRERITARLFDASGRDRDVELTANLIRTLGRDKTLWVDLAAPEAADVEQIGKLFDLRPETVRALTDFESPPRVGIFDRYLVLGVHAVESVDEDGSVPLAMVAGPTFVVTVHARPAACLEAFQEHLRGDTAIGKVDGPAFLAALLDWHLTVAFQAVDRLEREADRLDQQALHPRSERDLLDDLVRLRRRISNLRRGLTPQREAFAALTRPELSGLGDPDDTVHFRALAERLERAIDAVEVARELVLGSFDVHMTRTAQRTNDVMKLLTLATVILLPGSVIAGIMGMNFKVGLFEEPAVFWIVIAAMVAIAVVTVGAARFKRWI